MPESVDCRGVVVIPMIVTSLQAAGAQF